VRVLNDAENVSERVENRRNANAVPDLLHRRTLGSAERDEAFESCLRVRNTPIGDRTRLTAGSAGSIGIESQLVTAHVVANVKRLVEVRLNPEDGRIPSLTLAEVGRVINDRAQSVKVWVCGWYVHVI